MMSKDELKSTSKQTAVKEGHEVENKLLKGKRTSIINQGDIYNQRNIEKEAIRAATFDTKQSIPTQIWYDSLRETDDGRFSASEVFRHHGSMQQQAIS